MLTGTGTGGGGAGGGKSSCFSWTGTMSTAVSGTTTIRGPSDDDPFDETWNRTWQNDSPTPQAADINDLFSVTVPFSGVVTDFAITSRCNGGGTLVCDIDLYKLAATDASATLTWTKIGTMQSWTGSEGTAVVYKDTGAFSSGNAVSAGDVLVPLVYVTTGVSASLTMNIGVTVEAA